MTFFPKCTPSFKLNFFCYTNIVFVQFLDLLKMNLQLATHSFCTSLLKVSSPTSPVTTTDVIEEKSEVLGVRDSLFKC